ncbi:MAG TPA: DUF308 domain-containing protein [Gemmatimonadaceae bacterium]|nr:DUF308 domain-containing protein [Gemmatimonadaceae bacterium]
MRIAVIDVDTLSRNWWAVLLRGVAGVLFGIATLLAPGISLAALVLLYGAYAFVDGVFSIASAILRHGAIDRWWLLLLRGLVGVVAGVVTVLWPGLTALALLYLIAIWALITGGLELGAAVRLRKVISNEWLLALSSLAAIALGVLLLLFPGVGALAVVLWIGAYALVTGALLIALGIRLHALRSHHHPRAAPGVA